MTGNECSFDLVNGPRSRMSREELLAYLAAVEKERDELKAGLFPEAFGENMALRNRAEKAEKERDEALRDVKQLHDAAVETEDNLDALKAGCCATHEADNARCIKLEARVKVLEVALKIARNSLIAWNSMGFCERDAIDRVTRLYEKSSEIKAIDAALAGKEEVGLSVLHGIGAIAEQARADERARIREGAIGKIVDRLYDFAGEAIVKGRVRRQECEAEAITLAADIFGKG